MSLRSSSTMIFKMFEERTGNRKRCLSLGSLCLGSYCIGLILGWPESSLSYVLLAQCDSTSCNDSSTVNAGNIQMIMKCGSCIGALVPLFIADTYGRRSSFAIAGVLNLTFWFILVILHGHLEIIIVAAIGGIAAGVFITTTALYVSEISLPHTRGANGALVAFCGYVGALVASCLMFTTFNPMIALIMTSLATFFLASLYWWMVESPYYFFLQGKTLEAKISLKNLRGAATLMEIDSEYKTIELLFMADQNDSTIERSKNCCLLMSMSRKRRYATFVIILLCITQMVGAYGMEDYSMTFLNVVSPNYGRVVIAFLDALSVAICLCVIEKFGRKFLLIAISIVGSSISGLILALVALIEGETKERHENHEIPTLLSATILGLYYTIYALGLTPILPILTGEIFPSRYKTVALGCCVSFVYLTSMIIQFTFELLNARQGANLAFASFAFFGALGIPFAFSCLLELRGKTLMHEIQDEFDEFTIILC